MHACMNKTRENNHARTAEALKGAGVYMVYAPTPGEDE